ncbi:hypothetical protein [Ktedonospora formicarum]|uniref:hypothetical protein n=1 Tax=Ktedonospora formicarum TaxID=2778364 RepID=UPI001C687980|nr:hypothetical protein [Ktedonospora formicarum]
MPTESDSRPSPEDQPLDALPEIPGENSPAHTNEVESVSDKEQPASPEISETTTSPSQPEEFTPNGGPLGCCMGTVAGIFILLLLVTGLPLLITNKALPRVYFLPSLLLVIVGALICGFFGWRIGKRFYREYEPPSLKSANELPGRVASTPEQASGMSGVVQYTIYRFLREHVQPLAHAWCLHVPWRIRYNSRYMACVAVWGCLCIVERDRCHLLVGRQTW